MAETIDKRLVTEAKFFAGLGLRDARLAALESSAGFIGEPLEYETEALKGMLSDPAGAIGKIIRDVYGPTFGDRPVGKGELEVSANDEGAKGDGSDDSEAWTRAINKVAARGGGIVTAQPGEYVVEGLPLKDNVWLQLEGVVLKQSPFATKAMFIAAEAAKFAGGGIRGGELVGYNKTQNGIDFGAVTTLEHFVLENTYIRNFNIGWNGSQNDRFPMLRDTKFWFNKIGVYVSLNHPIVHFCDFRNNDVGVTGTLNDVYFLGCKFNFNRVGVQPDPDRAGSIISNTRFVGCAFSRNTEKGLVITHSNSVTSCQFYGNDSNDDGLTITHSGNSIVSNLFGYMTQQGSWGGACIRFAGPVTVQANIISANFFQLGSPTGAGIAWKAGTATIRNVVFRGNSFTVSHTAKAFDLAAAPLSNCKVSGNSVLATAASSHPAGSGIAEFGSLGPDGSDFVDNVFTSDRSANPANAIKFASLNGCTLIANRFRGFAAPLSATFWDGSKWSGNNGFVTASDGLASVAVGTTAVVVQHGISHPSVSARHINVTATNDMSAATKFWVAAVTSTSFEIRVNNAPGGYSAQFRWSASVGA